MRDFETVKAVFHNFDLAHKLEPVVKLEDVLSDNLSTTLSNVKSPAFIISIIIFHILTNFWMIFGVCVLIRYGCYIYAKLKGGSKGSEATSV